MIQRRINEDLFGVLIDQVDTASSAAGGRKGIPEWLCKNTSHPTNHSKNWSFKDHYFQIGLLECQAPHIAVTKPSQCGLSEISVRLAVALLAKMTGIHAIYSLPSARFASKFSSSRFDPVIDSSPRLRHMVPKTASSMELKKIGSSYLHVVGASSSKQAISIPASILINDEVSFSNPDALSVLQSRLGHLAPDERIQVDLSTPLFHGSGISALFERGTQHEYMMYHDKCGNWVVLNSAEDMVIPGFDQHIFNLTLDDLDNGLIDITKAWLKCPACHSEISRADAADPSKRAWVPRYPDRTLHSFCVDPSAMPGTRSPPQLIGDLRLYKKMSRFVQFALGKPYDSADATILESVLDKAFQVNPISPLIGKSTIYNSVCGMDVGNISHLCHGKKVDGVLHVFNFEKVKQSGDNELAATFVERFHNYRCGKGVIDNAPDITVVKSVQSRVAYRGVVGGYYVSGRVGALSDTYEEDEIRELVKIRRTELMDEMVLAFNNGKILLPKGLSWEPELRKHLLTPKRITVVDATGEESAKWISSSSHDHCFHALCYLWVASKMLEVDTSIIVMPAGRFASKAKVGGAVVANRGRG